MRFEGQSCVIQVEGVMTVDSAGGGEEHHFRKFGQAGIYWTICLQGVSRSGEIVKS